MDRCGREWVRASYTLKLTTTGLYMAEKPKSQQSTMSQLSQKQKI